MTRSLLLLPVLALLATAPLSAQIDGNDCCTNVLVSRGASADGSVIISYSADANFMPKLWFHQGGTHEAGTEFDVVTWESDEARGPIAQVAETYSVVGLINEHQLSLAETTTTGRKELQNEEGLLDYDALMWLTLQRAKTAREAIRTIDELCEEYGYASTAETISIADKNEAWMLEICGKGPGIKGAVWVAARVPEGYMSAHANMSRITTFPLDDPDNWLYADDVISFAIDKGYYDPESGEPFSFRRVYHPDVDGPEQDVGFIRACAPRVWSIFRRAAPSLELDFEFHRGTQGATPYPLFIKPENKLAVADVMALMRDHFEGTELDQSEGLAAGPFASPYRFRNLHWSFEGQDYAWERGISTQQAGFVMVAQSRNWLPDPIGGVYWFTPDDCYTSCFTPLYCGITELPEPYAIGEYDRYDPESAWWVFNLVSNLCYDRWSRVFPDVLAAQVEHEQEYFAMLPAIDRAAAELLEKDEALARRFLTDWSVASAESLFEDWQELTEAILTKHVDGYIQTPEEGSRGVNYPDDWLRRVIEEEGDALRLPSPEPKQQG